MLISAECEKKEAEKRGAGEEREKKAQSANIFVAVCVSAR
jgi:hypothetical protein